MIHGKTIRQRVPSIVVVVLSILGLAAVILMFCGGSKVGATWDERIHAVMLSTYFDNGWYASPDWLVNGAPGPKLGDWPYYVYAPVAELFTHVVTVIAGQEAWGGFSDSQGAYAARHVGTALMALIGIVAAGLTTKLVTRSWRWALVTAAFVASVPMWVGHGMFNVKDLPVGTGYTLVTLGFVALLRTSYVHSARLRVLAYVSIISGVLLAIGTRPASGLPMAMTIFGMAILFIVLLVRRSAPSSLLPRPGIRLLDLVVASIASYIALVAIYPKGFINPYVMAHETLAISGKFPVYDAVLTNGTWLQQPVPWFYLPTWFGAQLPILILLLLLVFFIWWIAAVVALIRSRGNSTKRRLRMWETCLMVVPVGLQVFLLPGLAILLHSTMYNAVRQFLFVVPAVTILATIGLRGLLGWRVSKGGALRIVIWTLVTIGVALPIVDQVRLFPYGYVYFNELASLKPIDGNWATDYWRASSQELAQIVPDGPESCRFVDAKHEAQPCADQAPFAPFWHEQGVNAIPGSLGDGQYWLVRENGGDVTTPEGCALHDVITRPLRGQTITIAQVFTCETR